MGAGSRFYNEATNKVVVSRNYKLLDRVTSATPPPSTNPTKPILQSTPTKEEKGASSEVGDKKVAESPATGTQLYLKHSLKHTKHTPIVNNGDPNQHLNAGAHQESAVQQPQASQASTAARASQPPLASPSPAGKKVQFQVPQQPQAPQQAQKQAPQQAPQQTQQQVQQQVPQQAQHTPPVPQPLASPTKPLIAVPPLQNGDKSDSDAGSTRSSNSYQSASSCNADIDSLAPRAHVTSSASEDELSDNNSYASEDDDVVSFPDDDDDHTINSIDGDNRDTNNADEDTNDEDDGDNTKSESSQTVNNSIDDLVQ